MGSSARDEIGRIGDDVVDIGKRTIKNPVTFFNPIAGLALSAGQKFYDDATKIPTPGDSIPEAPEDAPTLASQSVQDALSIAKLKRNSKSGRAGTIKTSSLGITERAGVKTKELLGE